MGTPPRERRGALRARGGPIAEKFRRKGSEYPCYSYVLKKTHKLSRKETGLKEEVHRSLFDQINKREVHRAGLARFRFATLVC
jgi:hypothetical protein